MQNHDVYLSHFQSLLTYNDWANRALLTALESKFVQTAADYLAHLLVAEQTWLGRLAGAIPAMPLFPKDESTEQLADLLRETQQQWRQYFETLTPETLQAVCQYQNTKGQAFETDVRDVLTHVFNHSTYHRAQAAMAMRQSGAAPAVTDFIAFVRS